MAASKVMRIEDLLVAVNDCQPAIVVVVVVVDGITSNWSIRSANQTLSITDSDWQAGNNGRSLKSNFHVTQASELWQRRIEHACHVFRRG